MNPIGAVLNLGLIASLVASCGDESAVDYNQKILFVRVGNQKPDKKCTEVGAVVGTTSGKELNLYRKSLHEMKLSAAQQGGNYVHVQQINNKGETIRGLAYTCEFKPPGSDED